ncbi:MAG: hypothetical protein WC560_10065, partial [Syntrophales bacterium]
IPVEDEEKWAEQYYKAYDMTRGLICKGDGESAMRMLDIKTGALPDKTTTTVTMKEMTCSGKDCPEYKAKKCGETMNLRFILPEVPGLGIWQIDTGSINSILNINSCAKIIKRAFGRISLIPLKLTLEPIDVNNPETGKKQKVFVLNLRTTVTMAQLADSAREQSKTFLLESPDLEAVYEQNLKDDTDALFGEGASKIFDSTATEVKQAPTEKVEATVTEKPHTTPPAVVKPQTEQPAGVPITPKASVKTLNTLIEAKDNAVVTNAGLVEAVKSRGWTAKSVKDLTEPQALELIKWLREKAAPEPAPETEAMPF